MSEETKNEETGDNEKLSEEEWADLEKKLEEDEKDSAEKSEEKPKAKKTSKKKATKKKTTKKTAKKKVAKKSSDTKLSKREREVIAAIERGQTLRAATIAVLKAADEYKEEVVRERLPKAIQKSKSGNLVGAVKDLLA